MVKSHLCFDEAVNIFMVMGGQYIRWEAYLTRYVIKDGRFTTVGFTGHESLEETRKVNVRIMNDSCFEWEVVV